MSKELEALKELRSFCGDVYYSEIYDKDYQIIETALKEYEYLKFINRCKDVKELDNAKKLKALEIIKEKRVNLYQFEYVQMFPIDEQLERYNDIQYVAEKDLLTQEEFDLLREVL